MKYGYPEVYGITEDKLCGHCKSADHSFAVSHWGVFCIACCRWLVYCGPKQAWGDGMDVK